MYGDRARYNPCVAEPQERTDDDDPPARRVRLKKGRCCGCLLVLLLVGLGGVFGAAAHALRYVPYEIDPADRPAEGPPDGHGITLRWLGVTGYELSDGRTTLLVDPVLTRPTLAQLWSGPLQPDAEAARRACPRADFILVNHAHHDHALDMPVLAEATGAKVVGGRSSLNLARARGIPEERLIEVHGGEHVSLGSFAVDVRRTRHPVVLGMSDFLPGTIPASAGPLWWFQYRQDGCLAFRFASRGAVVWFHPTSTWEPGELSGLTASTLILGVAGEPLDEARARAILSEVQPRRVIPTHWDNFFQPREQGLSRLTTVDLQAAEDAVRAAAPDVAWWVLDYDQRVTLPPE